jgi:peptidoglycan/xylan/chitin deacetylase (PgdA/CDA1 family)
MRITRRHVLSAALGGALSSSAAAAPGRRVSITIDDGPVVGDGGDLERFRKISAGLIGCFQAEQVPVVLFVNERQLNVPGQRDARADVLREWRDAGFEIGNHTYSHPDPNRVPLWQYQDSIVQGEIITRRLLAESGKKLVWFRHPFLHTGTTAEIASGIQSFLDQRGYRVAPVTVDYADYSFAGVYSRFLRSGDAATAQKVYQAYMEQVDAGFEEAEKLSQELLGYELPQILLIHCNELNSISLRDSIARMRKRGYSFVTLDEAMKDPAYQRKDDYLGAEGITWLRRWALASGKPQAPRLGLPAWIRDLPRNPPARTR